MLNKKIVTPLLVENTIIVFNIDALLSLSDYNNMNSFNNSPYHFLPELRQFLGQKNPDNIYLWSYNGALAPVVSYLQDKYNYNPEHTYWEPNPVKLLDYIRDTYNISEDNITSHNWLNKKHSYPQARVFFICIIIFCGYMDNSESYPYIHKIDCYCGFHITSYIFLLFSTYAATFTKARL